WTSRAPPESGFVAATGMGLDTWTQRWLARAYGTAPEKPTPSLGDLLWLATVLPLALFVAARPRQRVLAERLFASRA
ncbi:MAG: hypothetical protein ACJ77Q_00895, partial [Gemmatimonadaceae bacterium]